jgi:hypothetical protein
MASDVKPSRINRRNLGFTVNGKHNELPGVVVNESGQRRNLYTQNVH